MNRPRSVKDSNSEIYNLPYYGGLKGQVLKVEKKLDGTVTSTILQHPAVAAPPPSEELSEGRSHFDNNFSKIQEAATRLVAIQEAAKQKGTFTAEDNKIYADNLYQLGMAAQNLAKLQQNGEVPDFSKLLEGSNNDAKPIIDPPISTPQEHEEPAHQEAAVDATDYNDSVAINAPKKEASVAESKPVGLSIAGEGGVASSKPNAVAIAGKQGLAVSAPKATAIAGVSPENVAALGVSIPSRKNHDSSKYKYGLRKNGFLSGPEETESDEFVSPTHPLFRTKKFLPIFNSPPVENLNKFIPPTPMVYLRNA